VNFSTQTHDFDPGFGPPVNAQGDRFFWTAAIPDRDVKVNFAAGKAEMHVRDLLLEDYFNLPNAAADGGPPGPGLGEVDATVSFDVVWDRPVTRRVNVRDTANDFAGTFVENQASMTWSASNELGFRFTANPGDFSTSVPEAGPFAELGLERNGIFFPLGRSAHPADAAPDPAFARLASPGDNRGVPRGSVDFGSGRASDRAGLVHASEAAPQAAGLGASAHGPVRAGRGRPNDGARDRLFAGFAEDQDRFLFRS
jgi:hypothetical protein